MKFAKKVHHFMQVVIFSSAQLYGAAAASAGPAQVKTAVAVVDPVSPYRLGVAYMTHVQGLEQRYQALVADPLLTKEEKKQLFAVKVNPILSIQCKQLLRRADIRIPRLCVSAFLSKKLQELGVQGCWEFVTRDLRLCADRFDTTALAEECGKFYCEMVRFYATYGGCDVALFTIAMDRLPDPEFNRGKEVFDAYQKDRQRVAQTRNGILDKSAIVTALKSSWEQEYVAFRRSLLGTHKHLEEEAHQSNLNLKPEESATKLWAQTERYVTSLPAHRRFNDNHLLTARCARTLFRLAQNIFHGKKYVEPEVVPALNQLYPMTEAIFVPSSLFTNWSVLLGGKVDTYDFCVEHIAKGLIRQNVLCSLEYTESQVAALRDHIAFTIDTTLDFVQQQQDEQACQQRPLENVRAWSRQLPLKDIPPIIEPKIVDPTLRPPYDAAGDEEALRAAIAAMVQPRSRKPAKL